MAHGSGVTRRGRRDHRRTARAHRCSAPGRCGGSATGSGDSVSGHGPDADAHRRRRARLDRAGRPRCSSPPGTSPSPSSPPPLAGDAGHRARRAAGWCCGRCCCARASAGPAIAIGSGRAAIWAAYLPPSVRGAAAPPACGSCSPSSLVSPLVVPGRAGRRPRRRRQRDVPAAHRRRRRHAVHAAAPRRSSPTPWPSPAPTCSAPASRSAPHTLVSPTVVVLGPLPMFPLLAALPDNGPTPALDGRCCWRSRRVVAARRRGPRAAPPPDAALGRGRAARLRRRGRSPACCSGCSRRSPAARSARAGCATSGRSPFEVLVHAVTAFGIGGLVGGLVDDAGWQRRRRRRRTAEHRRARSGPPRLVRLRRVPNPTPARLVVLVSGAGTNLQALLDAARGPGVRRPRRRRRRRPRRHRGPGPRRARRRPDLRAAGRATSPAATHWDGALTDTVAALRARPRRARPAS